MKTRDVSRDKSIKYLPLSHGLWVFQLFPLSRAATDLVVTSVEPAEGVMGRLCPPTLAVAWRGTGREAAEIKDRDARRTVAESARRESEKNGCMLNECRWMYAGGGGRRKELVRAGGGVNDFIPGWNQM